MQIAILVLLLLNFYVAMRLVWLLKAPRTATLPRTFPEKLSAAVKKAVAEMKDDFVSQEVMPESNYRPRMTADEFAAFAEKRHVELHKSKVGTGS